MKSMRTIVLVSTALLVVGMGAACHGGSSEGEFTGGPGMLYFYSPECPICQSMRPIVDDLEDEYGRDFEIVRVNVDRPQGESRARAHGIVGQPSFLIFDSSNEEVRRLMGPQERQTLELAIQGTLD
jgi:thiol-disulfide isomerase/thioredoxin